VPRAPRFPRRDHHVPRPRLDARVDELVSWLQGGRQDRAVLAQRMRLPDRALRRLIEEARRRGVLVITTKGPLHQYELAPAREEYERWRRHEVMGRMGSFGAQLRAMDAAADRVWPAEQLRLGT
jgi:hypothetical protein